MYGIITLTDRNFLSELTGSNLFTGAAYALVISSALACLLAFFGCFGAVKEIKCMLLTVSSRCLYHFRIFISTNLQKKIERDANTFHFRFMISFMKLTMTFSNILFFVRFANCTFQALTAVSKIFSMSKAAGTVNL